MAPSLLIAGGTVVTDGARLTTDLLIAEGTVAALGAGDTLTAAPGSDVTVIDATGCLVIPGAVDAHVHPFGDATDDGIAAACGGTTTAVAFIDGEPGESPSQAARRTIEEELPQSPIDLALHSVIWEPGAYRAGDLAEIADLGVTSVKLWLAYEELGIMASDDQVFQIMSEAAEQGVLVLAHCENGPLVSALAQRLRDTGRPALAEHGRVRPMALEAEAVHRFLRIAQVTGAAAYVVHVSGRDSLDEVRRARDRGQRVGAEACTHHLILDQGVYDGPDPLRFMVTPPLRDADDGEALWQALADGTLGVLSSDHGHVRLDPDKLAAADDVTAVPYGLPGIQWRLGVGFTAGVNAGRLSVERLVEVTCAEPARAFGLYPRKGTLLPGADADVVVWDPALTTTVGSDTRRDGVDYSPYDGLEMRGAPRLVIAGGEVVVRDGAYVGGDRRGRFLPRSPLRSGSPHDPADVIVTAG